MKIVITGLCTLHWGRLEYGNAGNYYIMEPLFRELHRVFPKAELMTTFQMTNGFVKREKVTVLPMEWYYGWNDNDLPQAFAEYGAALYFAESGHLQLHTGFIDAVLESEMVVNVSGDMWGDNAEHVGHNRFLIDLLKMRTAQLLGKKTVLFAGTPGPFSDETTCCFAKEVFEHFDFVPNREEMASSDLIKWGFNTSKVKNYACPAFLFEPEKQENIRIIFEREGIPYNSEKPLIGFTICGFNMPKAPYDIWPRENTQYDVFAEAIEHIINGLGGRVVLISHTNGFDLPPDFKLINGRDYPINKQLREYVLSRGKVKNENDLLIINNPYIPKVLKGIIGHFDMFITGRLHASVAAISQTVPTVFIMHGKEFIRSTKIIGFARLAGVEEFVCEPYDAEDMVSKIDACWGNRVEVRNKLRVTIPVVQEKSHDAFHAMARVLKS